MRARHAVDLIAEDVLDRLDQQAQGCSAREYQRLLRQIVDRLCDRLAGRKARHCVYPRPGRTKRCQTE
ncbi:MAG: hypothetical protein JW741_17365 [Sedimentisphaerales bacterium]|nr:hypothetical protein [Sedimentisphaerales bacterium]